MEHYEHLEKALCKELDKLDKKYMSSADMTDQDAERADTLYHALKSAATYHAMKDAEEMDKEDEEYSRRSRSYRGGSYARYRSPRMGRYVSRDMGEDYYSGRYPMEYIDPNWDRRY